MWLARFIRSIFEFFWPPKKYETIPIPKRDEPEDTAARNPTPTIIAAPSRREAPWLKIARRDLGVKEIEGSAHNPKIIAYFRKAGFGWVDDDETAWCAAYCCSVLEDSGFTSPKNLAARSFLTWGKPLKKPKPGCIVVFWRGKRNGWQGHVGFYLGETDTHVTVLGGNQRDSVSIVNYPKRGDKMGLLGYRWPPTLMNSRTNAALTSAGVGSASLAGLLASDFDLAAHALNGLGDLSYWFRVAAVALTIGGILYAAYARDDDRKKKGR